MQVPSTTLEINSTCFGSLLLVRWDGAGVAHLKTNIRATGESVKSSEHRIDVSALVQIRFRILNHPIVQAPFPFRYDKDERLFFPEDIVIGESTHGFFSTPESS